MKASPYLIAEGLSVQRGTRQILDEVSVGIHPGDRIGVVGRNGSGKSTLLAALTGEPTDSGRLAAAAGIEIAMVGQRDDLPGDTVRQCLVGDRPAHEWASDPSVRAVLGGLVGGLDAPLFSAGLDTNVSGLSGGESRRIALASSLIRPWDLLLLDEPTNHLDLEAVGWLANHLKSLPSGRRAFVLVTHDRWLLDEVTSTTWEVTDGHVAEYQGGYAAHVLAKAQRDEQARTTESKRRNLMRKELAWLRRGAPARTSKAKFRVDAAEELIANEPPPRDSLALHRVATTRLGKTVIDVEDMTLRPQLNLDSVLEQATWNLGPGDRIGLLGPNGVGKTTLLRLLLGVDPPPTTGFVRRGKTVAAAVVDQRLSSADSDDRVSPWLKRTAEHAVVTTGKELTSTQLLEAFGFLGDAAWKRLGDLSGGERRRLEFLRVLLTGPNLLLLDEPTNDLDIDTLTVIEDLLDDWPGTLVVVSHDRYFLERTCDDVFVMLGDKKLRHAPGGVTEYLELRAQAAASSPPPSDIPDNQTRAHGNGSFERPARGSSQERYLRKQLAKLERQLSKLESLQAHLHQELAEAATDPPRLIALSKQLRENEDNQQQLEDEWLKASEELDG